MDGQLVHLQMTERRVIQLEVSEGPHVVNFEHLVKKFNPEPTQIPAGLENVTVVLALYDENIFKTVKWITPVLVGE